MRFETFPLATQTKTARFCRAVFYFIVADGLFAVTETP
jgi:hypothetical protein